MSFRKEKKYRLSRSDMATIEGNLLARGMVRLHPLRVVKSCYFDTQDLVLYHESEEGVLPRKKIRIRWYNDEMKFTKETKISSIEGRYKYTEKDQFSSSLDDVKRMQYFDQTYGRLCSVLLVMYEREYFSLRDLRVTFDRNISYKSLQSVASPTYHDNECVMEVKVPIDCDDDYIESIINHPTSRFSKYSRGLLFTDGMM